MEGIIKQTVKDFTKTSETIQTIIIAIIAFVVPTFLAQLIKMVFGAESIITNNSQIIVGSIVNTMLILAALNIKGWSKNIFIVTMPSISTILSGYIFKSASVYMVWMIPAIWLGNFILILAIKYFILKKEKNYIISCIVGIIAKVAIIFGMFSVLNLFNIFPEKMVTNLQTAMGITQLITATIGGIISFIIYKLEKIDNKEGNLENE